MSRARSSPRLWVNKTEYVALTLGAIQVFRNAVGGGGVSFPGKKPCEGVRFNVISIMRGCMGVKFPGKKRYVTHEWPLTFTLKY